MGPTTPGSWHDSTGEASDRPRETTSIPIEGTDNTPLDPREARPRVEWCDGDPPLDPGNLRSRDAVVYVRPERRDDRNPDSGLGRPGTTPDASLPTEVRQGSIDLHRDQAAKVLGIEGWSNSKYAGQMYDKLTPSLRERFPHGVQFSNEGFPMMDRYAVKTVVFEEGFRGPDRDDDFRRANAIFGWSRRPPAGLTWHHKEDGKTMLLLDERLHRKVGHYGGVAVSKAMGLWEGEG